MWPEGLSHYVADHNVRLPDEFVACAANKHFLVAPVELGSVAMHGGMPAREDAWWIRWVAENTSPPAPAADACSLEEAQAVCADLATNQWQAFVSFEYGRWRIRQVRDVDAIDDFTAPISRAMLYRYLFRTRQG